MLSSLGEIAKKRKLLGLTQKRLAELAGVSQSLIAKVESGKIDPSFTKVKAVFEALYRLEASAELEAGEILHAEVISVQKDALVSEAVELMRKHGYSQLPVFDGEHAVGSISEKTILKLVLSGKDLSQISTLRVKEVMGEVYPQLDEAAPITVISSLLQVYPAVLISQMGKTTGIITKADLLKIV